MKEGLRKLQEKVAKSKRPNSKAHTKNVEKMEKLHDEVTELDQKLRSPEMDKNIENKIVAKHQEEKNLGGEDREKQEEELERMKEGLRKLQEKVAKSKRPNSKAHTKNIEKMKKLHDKVSGLDQKLRSPEMDVYLIAVPEDAVRGEMFTALAGEKFVRLKCPEHVNPGDILQLTVPKKDPNVDSAARDSEDILKIPGTEDAEGRWDYLVKVPDEVEPGAKFPVTISGMQLVVTCPEGAKPGAVVKIRPPAALVFEVVVPQGIEPGFPFPLLADGVRVQVSCPRNAKPGMKIRFNLPKVLLQQNEEVAKPPNYVDMAWEFDEAPGAPSPDDLLLDVLSWSSY